MFKLIDKRRITAIIIREFNEIIRDPLYFAMAILIPPFIMIIFGFGLALDVNNIPLGICDRDHTMLSREYIDSYIRSDSFKLAGRYNDFAIMSKDIQNSKLRAALIIPENFQKDIRQGKKVSVQIIIDGTIPMRAEVARGYAISVHNHFLAEIADYKVFLKKFIPHARIAIYPRILFNPQLKSSNFIVPGLIATVLMFYPALLTTLSIVREKESGSIMSLYCSPVHKLELLLGKLIPYLSISFVNFVSTFLLAIFLFHVPFNGGYTLLGLASILYVFGTCGLGLFISVLVNTQVSAILITMVATLIPSFLYTGFFMPLSTASWGVWILSRFVSATYYLRILRELFLKGTGLAIVWPSVLALIIYASVLYILTFTLFRKRMD